MIIQPIPVASIVNGPVFNSPSLPFCKHAELEAPVCEVTFLVGGHLIDSRPDLRALSLDQNVTNVLSSSDRIWHL